MKSRIIKIVLLLVLGFQLNIPNTSALDISGREIYEKRELKESYQKLTCPKCGREFEVQVSGDVELDKGIGTVTCPYDGYTFLPEHGRGDRKKELVRRTVRCPVDDREFKADVDISAILDGRGYLLRCPYDGTEFMLGASPVDEKSSAEESGLAVVRCPTDGREFSVRIDPENPEEVICPYDGTRFYPSPETIVSMPFSNKVTASAAPQGFKKTALSEDFSVIEKMFSRDIPQNIARDIRQFGYDIFVAEEEEEEVAPAQGMNSSLLSKSSRTSLLSGEGLGRGGISGYKKQDRFTPFSFSSSIPVSKDYVLGPADTLIVNIWGSIQQTFPLTIDAEGKVMLPKVGPVYLWGLTFGKAEELIKRRLLEHYTNIKFNITMGNLRTIRVFVFGEVVTPGAYTLTSQATVLHSLYAAGGPTKAGTMRKIKLIRANKREEMIDLYDILIDGKGDKDLRLNANDTILVSPIAETVGIAGGVKRPAIYEVSKKVSLGELLVMAGGINAVSYIQRIQIERVSEHQRKIVNDFEFTDLSDLEKKAEEIYLQDGDLALVERISSLRRDFVSISGNVERPGDYELEKDMRVKDIIYKARGILPGTHISRAELSRFKDGNVREILPLDIEKVMKGVPRHNILLKEWDVLTIYSQDEVLPLPLVEVQGAVYRPGEYPLADNMKVSDIIFRAGGLTRSASAENAEIFRTVPGELPKVIGLNILAQGDFLLKQDDRLFVRQDSEAESRRVVYISGEVKYPGEYIVRKEEKLSSVIKRAGGWTEAAFLEGAVFTRESIKESQRKMVKQFIERQQNALLEEEGSMSTGYATSTQSTARQQMIEHRRELLDEMKSAEVMGRILIRLRELEEFEGSVYDVRVEDGDTLHIPQQPISVQVVGSVFNPASLTYIEGKGINYYLKRVGGITKNADRRNTYVIRASGETMSRFVKIKKVLPGDTLIVPEAFKYRRPWRSVFQESVDMVYKVAFGAAALAALD